MDRKVAKKIDHNQYREALLEGVVRAGAAFDLGGITNQTIAEMSGQSEPYIYRYFFDRDDLIRKAFFKCDENFFAELTKNVSVLHDSELTAKEKFFKFMNLSLDFMVKDFDFCKFYVRYYYSNANTRELMAEHKKICLNFYNQISMFFIEEMNADRVMHQLFSNIICNVMDMAIGITEDTPEVRNQLFEIMFIIAKPYLKSTVEDGKDC